MLDFPQKPEQSGAFFAGEPGNAKNPWAMPRDEGLHFMYPVLMPMSHGSIAPQDV
jgi:hypothetical protein